MALIFCSVVLYTTAMSVRKKRQSSVVAIGGVYIDINFPDVPIAPPQWGKDQDVVLQQYHLALGGSATLFSLVAGSLGMRPHLIAKIGQDEAGASVRALLKHTSIVPHLIIDPHVQTVLATNIIDTREVMYGIAGGDASARLRATEAESLAQKALRQSDFLYIGSFFKMTHLTAMYIRLAKYAHTHNVQVVLDHGRVNSRVRAGDIRQMKRLLPHVDLYLPSEQEFQRVWHGHSLSQAVQHMRRAYQGALVVTRGKHGAIGFVEGARIGVPGFPVTVHHPVGAGDSFNAGLLWGLSRGEPLSAAIRAACATAAVKISQTSVPTPAHVRHLLRQ